MDPTPLLLSVPYGQGLQIVNSTRYYWDSSQRGGGPFVILQCSKEGTGVFELEGESWTLSPGTAFIAIVPEASRYYFPKQATEPWKVSWLNLYGSLAISYMAEFRRVFGPVNPLPLQSAAGRMFARLAELAEKRSFPDSYEASAAFYAFLMQWARQLTLPTNPGRDKVEIALALCRSRFHEPLGIKELAAETGLTREHLTRIFTARTGISPGRFLRDLRVDAARQMLSGRGIPLKEVALRCGFTSVRSLNQSLAEAEK